MNRRSTVWLALGVVALAAVPVVAAPESADDHAAQRSDAAASASAATPMADGEVRKIDKAQGKLTLRHGPIAKLGMPAMTMVFRVADAKLLDAIKEGDKVRFAADRVNGAITVTAIEPLR